MKTLLENPNWSAVIELVQEYMGLLSEEDTTTDDLSEFDAQVFEAVLEACYGKSIFDEINAILNEL